MTSLQGLLPPVVAGVPPERSWAKFQGKMLQGPAYVESNQSRHGLSACRRSDICSLGTGPSTNIQPQQRGGSIIAKVVRQRHKEIDRSEKLMEDPYGHVCDVMSSNVVSVKCEELACIKDAKDTIVWTMDLDVFEHYTGLPVVESGGNCVGVLTAADYENRVGNRQSDQWRPLGDDEVPEVFSTAVSPLVGLPVSAIMSTPAIIIKEHAPIAYAAALMLQNKVHRLPVADTNGLLVGIITRTDIFEPLSEMNPVYHVLAGKHREDVPEFTDE